MKRNILIFLMAIAAVANAQPWTAGTDAPGSLPAPEWKSITGGMATAELRIIANGAAAMRLNFGGLFLPEGGEMVLSSRDADGRVLAIHGPDTGSGPLNIPSFESQILAGSEVVVSVRANATDAWPFTLNGVEQFDPETAAGFNLRRAYTPAPARKYPVDFRSAYIGDTLVNFSVEDGMAVMEGDILLGTVEEINGGGAHNKNGDRASFALTNTFASHWPNGVVPYVVAYGGAIVPSDKIDQNISAAVAHWNSRFPGILVKRTNQTDYVEILSTSGICLADVGRKGGKQSMKLGFDCSTGAIIHEFGHSLGLLHEQTRYDRDGYVKIDFSNIQADKVNQFTKRNAGEAVNVGPYDFASIMHYSARAFAIDPAKDVITPLVAPPPGVVIGMSSVLSAGDEASIRARYCSSGFYTAPSLLTLDPDGETRQFSVTLPPYCAWQVSETSSWITINSAPSGTGSTIVKFTASANNGAAGRSATLKFSGRLIELFQPKLNLQ